MTQSTLPSARTILADELKAAQWSNLTDPKEVFDVLDACMDRTYKQVRSACWGNRARTMACDVLFREAQASSVLARASLNGATVSTVQQGQDAGKKADWLQPVLLLLGAVLTLLGSVRGFHIISILIGILAALCILAALMREVQRLLRDGAGAKILSLAVKVFKKAKIMKWIEKCLPPAGAAQKHVQQVQYTVALNTAALEEVCLQQMDVIDSNLGLFQDQGQQKDDTRVLLPLVRTILQEKYAGQITFPESVEAELGQYLRANNLRAVEYDAQHASMFQTQPMDETFTIFPAITDSDGSIIEYGLAGVREE